MADQQSLLFSNSRFPSPPSQAEDACAEVRRTAQALHLKVPETGICEDLYVAVEQAAERSEESMDRLREAVSHFTAALRDEGAKPEAVLIALKSMINSRAFPAVRNYRSDYSGEVLRQKISAWSIEEFFRDAQA